MLRFNSCYFGFCVVVLYSCLAQGQQTLPLTTTGAGGVTIPAGYEWANVTVQCWGGGGGGGNGTTYNATGYGGSGGGGGAYSYKTYTTLAPGAYSYYVGAGGMGEVNYGGGFPNGSGSGGSTIWNYGGAQDIIAGGGGSGISGSAGGGGGSVGAGTGYSGGGGGGGGGAYGGAGGGGGSGGPSGPGGTGGQGTLGNGSAGGTGSGGAGYGPGGSGGVNAGAGGNEDGYNGTFPGGGGGGGGSNYFSYRYPSDNNGGQGANGEIIITYTPEALATIALNNALSATIITGGTGTLGATIGNSASANLNLNYTLTAAVLSGSATLGQISPFSWTVAPGSNQPCTLAAASTTFGVNAVSLTASDPNSSNLSQTTTATLTVLDHSNASLSSGSVQTTQAIHFGNVLRGATVPSQTFTIHNLAANTSAEFTANLALTGFTPSSNAAFQSNLATINGLTAASGSNGNTFTASLNTSSYMTGRGTISMSASQLADDSTLPGAGTNNNGGLTITLDANVGNATADASNSQTSFGTPLTALVAKNASYANLASTAIATTGSGGDNLIGSTATILAGTNASSGTTQTVSMAWRTQTLGEGLFSDVLDLSGMALSGSSGQTAPFVLKMTYNPGLILSANELPYLGWLNPNTNQWENAVLSGRK